MPLSVGDHLGAYEIRSPIGAGGMGEVYRARHVRLGRDVALKVLPARFASDHERLRRFEREARAASALNHPNIVTIYDVDEHQGIPFIAMELVEGKTLRDRLADGPLPLDHLLPLARQMAGGLAKAHAAGIVHRDLKPENVMVTEDGLVKILDFGLAKLSDEPRGSQVTTASAITRQGALTGTLQYVSPEQIAGRPADHRSDQFSFGALLYELLSGRRPFGGDSTAAVLGAILNDTPPPPHTVRPDAPRDLEHIIFKCLEKDPDRRHVSVADVGRQIEGVERRLAATGRERVITVRRPVVVALAVSVVVVLGATGWWWMRSAGARWARLEALPEITRLTEGGDLYGAYRLALQARRYLPDDERLQQMLERITLPVGVVTEPAGATVEVTGYATPEGPWESLGETPMQVRIPYALMRWKISKAGFETFEGAPMGGGPLSLLMTGLPLHPDGTRPPGMVWVPGGPTREQRDVPVVTLTEYWLDRYEVTNRQYQAFVNQGGYTTREHWPTPFVDDGRELPWEEAMSRLSDTTGRPGPATWEAGNFPEGQADLPVGGLSWYEAAAYCAFAGKSLPTLYHWYNAARQDQMSDIISFSNFGPDGPAPVGSYQGIGDYGTYDMAGNVKEWVWNATPDGKRYILGGAWGEPSYQFAHLDARAAFERLPTHGLRCARYPEPLEGPLTGTVEPARDFLERAPVSDEVFEVFRGLYAYDHTDLDARIESVDESSSYWRKETVSFAAAYGGERVTALLFLPRNAAPPFQTVLWFPGDDALFEASSDALASTYLFDFLPRAGRAFVYPIYKGMYERRMPLSFAPAEWRDLMLVWYKDLARTFDYLETRDDIDAGRVAFYGFSTAFYGTIFTAVDGRFRASVLLSTGLPPEKMLPEMNPVNFAPRSRVPTLMLNGRDDFIFPVEPFQTRLFGLLGAPEADKAHVLLDGGHLPPDRPAIIREVLGWLDRYLGPITPAGAAAAENPGR